MHTVGTNSYKLSRHQEVPNQNYTKYEYNQKFDEIVLSFFDHLDHVN
jgi:hypothetical protein